MCDFCPRLREQIDLLQEENRQLREKLLFKWRPPPEIGLTAIEDVIVAALVQHNRILSKQFLIDITRGTPTARFDYIDTKGMDTVIFNCRKRLKPHGMNIETVWAKGYVLTPETRARLLNWNSDPVHGGLKTNRSEAA